MSFRQTALTGALRSGKTDLVFSNHGHEKEERKKKKKMPNKGEPETDAVNENLKNKTDKI